METKPQTFIFREPRSAAELEALLRVRYKAYSESDFKFSLRTNVYQLEVDEFDFRAAFIGVFCKEGNQEIAVGSIRIILNSEGRYGNWLTTILKNKPRLKVKKEQRFDYFIEGICKQKQPVISTFIRSEQAKNKCVGEAGRLAIDKRFASLKLSSFFIEAMFVFGFEIVDVVLIRVKENVSKVYQRYGFQPIPNTFSILHGVPNQPHYVTPALFSSLITKKYDKLRTVYLKTGQICYHTDQANNFYLEKYQAAAL